MTAVIISTVSVALHIFGIYGAISYQSTAVGASAFGYLFSFVLALYSLNVTGIILCSLFFYAHAVLLLEIRNGIMTPYNYENIKACCECSNFQFLHGLVVAWSVAYTCYNSTGFDCRDDPCRRVLYFEIITCVTYSILVIGPIHSLLVWGPLHCIAYNCRANSAQRR